MPGPKPTTTNILIGSPATINNLDYIIQQQGVSIYQPGYLDDGGNLLYDDSCLATVINDETSGIQYANIDPVLMVMLGDIWGDVANRVGPPNMIYGGVMFNSGTIPVPTIGLA